MTGLFEIDTESVGLLNDIQLTRLLKRLLHLEVRSSGIAQRAVEVALNITVADGGEDGRVSWTDGPENTDYLPGRLVQFQVKATSMGPKACADELVDTQGHLKLMIAEVLGAGGAYILFNNRKINKKGKTERIKSIRKKLRDLGKPYADDVAIAVYDSSAIQGWVNNYLSAVTAAADWVNRPLVAGMQAWEEWSRREEYERFEFIPDSQRGDAIQQLRSELSEARKVARIIGLSGLGKTRLALEVFRSGQEFDQLTERVVYIDAAHGVGNIAGRISDWVRCGFEGVIVVDNCALALHKSLKVEISRADSQLSLLTLDYNPDQDSDTPTLVLKPLDDQYIKQMLEPVYKDTIPDLDRIASFAQGFPQMAVLLANARLNEAPEMGSLTDDDLLHRMLWGSDSQDDQALKSIQGCALFEHFGLKDRAVVEYQFIANQISMVDVDEFYGHIMEFQRRGIIDMRGDYGQVIPKPLAIRLAADWWLHVRPEKAKDIIKTPMPGRLDDGFCQRVEKLDFLPKFKDLVKELCGEQAPFGQAEVILSDRGSQLFRAFVEVNPTVTVRALWRVLDGLSKEELLGIVGDARRNLVWSLEKLCFREETFSEAARLLLGLASAENETWSNNATGQFVQLFSTFLSGTEAHPDMRLQLVEEALSSADLDTRRIAVDALGQALHTSHFSRSGGAEQQGSGKPLEDWRPKTWADAFSYWEAALEKLTTLVTTGDELSGQAKLALAHGIRGLMQYGRVEALESSIKSIVASQGPFWPEALDGIKNSLSYDGDAMPPEGRAKLEEWCELLQPVEQRDRLKLIVSTPPFEHEEGEDGHYIDLAAERAKELAREYAEKWPDLVPDLGILSSGEQRQGYIFGLTIAQECDDSAALIRESLNALAGMEHGNPTFLSGMLEALKNRDEPEWEVLVAKIVQSDQLSIYYPDLIRTGSFGLPHLEMFVDLVKQGKLEVAHARAFTYGRVISHLLPEEVAHFVTDLARFQPEGPWVALDILSMYCHGDKGKWQASSETFRAILADIRLSESPRHGQLDFHHWQKAVESLLGSGDADFAKLIARQILDALSDRPQYSEIEHNIKPVLHRLFQEYGKQVWPIFSEAIAGAEPIKRYKLENMMSERTRPEEKIGAVLEMPIDYLMEWCRSNPEFAPEFLAKVIPVITKQDDKWEFHPLARSLIDEFGNDEKVLSAISVNIGTYSWTGSLVPFYQRQEEAFNTIADHENPAVRKWASNNLSFIRGQIEHESRRDQEHDWGIY